MVINFWASWCVSCRDEAADLEAAWQRYRAEGVRFLDLSEEDVQAFVKEFGITYPSVRDVDKRLKSKFGVSAPPESAFIDHHFRFAAVGRAVKVGVRAGEVIRGPLPPAVLRAQVKSLLAQWEEEKGRARSSGPAPER